jgi:hypothetical protein
MTRYVLSFALLAASTGCGASPIPEPTTEDAARAATQWPKATQASLEQGRSLYIQSCAGCHPLHRPVEKSPAEWPSILDTMAPRAGLKDAQRQLIEHYLVTVAYPSR